jgi:hypothetical protein
VADFSTPDEWGLFPGDGTGMNVDPALPRMSALNALYRIPAQGEGPGQQKDSHFEQFVKMYSPSRHFRESRLCLSLPILPRQVSPRAAARYWNQRQDSWLTFWTCATRSCGWA